MYSISRLYVLYVEHIAKAPSFSLFDLLENITASQSPTYIQQDTRACVRTKEIHNSHELAVKPSFN